MTALPAIADVPQQLRWTVHPAAERPALAALILVVIALCGALAWSVAGSGWLGWLAAALLFCSLRAYFLPRTYVVDDVGARETGPLQAARALPWTDVRSVTRERHGVHLSPLHVASGRPSRLIPDRGVFLRLGPESSGRDTERVAAFVRERCRT